MASKNSIWMWGILGLLAVVLITGGNLSKLGLTGSTVAPQVSGGTPQPAGSTGSQACTAPLSAAQTFSMTAYDADKAGSTVATPTVDTYLNPSTGALSAGGNTTLPGTTYTLAARASSYFGTNTTLQTSCNAASVIVPLTMKAIDTAIVTNVYGQDGTTKNTPSTLANNVSITSGGTATVTVTMRQSAAYKHLTGEVPWFEVWVTTANTSDWNPGNMGATFDGQVCVTSAPQVPGIQTVTVTPSGIGGKIIVKQVFCKGDFAPVDGTLHRMAVTFAAATGVAPQAQIPLINFVGLDYFKNTINNQYQLGAAKDDGSAIQTIQNVSVYIHPSGSN